MNRTLLLLLVFVLLSGVAYLIFRTGTEGPAKGGDAWERQFAVEEVDRIHKIFLADRRGNKTLLERQSDHWTVNGDHKARPAAVEGLLDAVRRIELKFIPPQAAIQNMIESLAADGIKVELYDRQDELIKSYYVGGATADERGTYMIMEDSDNPYVVHIPSWEGNVRFRYNLVGDDWRDRTIFGEDPRQIASVSVEYPKQRGESFRLQRTGGGFSVEPFYELTPAIERAMRPGAAEGYLVGYERVIATDFRNALEQKDSIYRQVPFSIIRLEKQDGSRKEVRVWPIYNEYYAQDPKTGKRSFRREMERYFVDLNGEDLFLIQKHLIDQLFWSYSSFFQPQPEEQPTRPLEG
jgi:hypothetical protein